MERLYWEKRGLQDDAKLARRELRENGVWADCSWGWDADGRKKESQSGSARGRGKPFQIGVIEAELKANYGRLRIEPKSESRSDEQPRKKRRY